MLAQSDLHQIPTGSHVTSAYHHVRGYFSFLRFRLQKEGFHVSHLYQGFFHEIFVIPRMNIADIKNEAILLN